MSASGRAGPVVLAQSFMGVQSVGGWGWDTRELEQWGLASCSLHLVSPVGLLGLPYSVAGSEQADGSHGSSGSKRVSQESRQKLRSLSVTYP